MSNFSALPAITWGSSFSGSIVIQYPVDSWAAYSIPRPGSSVVQSQSGIEDSWNLGTDYMLETDIRWIPGTTTGTATGWDGTTGWLAFLEWAQLKNQFRWIPDSTATGTYVLSYLVEPSDKNATTIEPDGTRTLKMIIRNAAQPYTGY